MATTPANFSAVNKFPLGSALLKITGKLLPSPAAGQPFELKADAIEVIGLLQLDYPLQKKRHSFEFLRTIAHLRPRTNTFMAVFRVRSLLAYAIHSFFHERGFCLCAHADHHRQRLRGGQMFRGNHSDLKIHPASRITKSISARISSAGRPT